MTLGRSLAPALCTDHYELTMVETSLLAGTAEHQVTFEVFTRRLPPGRGFGVFCGLGRFLDALEVFRFGPGDLGWLASQAVVGRATLAWLAAYRFGGQIDAYPEGELYGPWSPVLRVTGGFAETVLLETVILSMLNYDSAVASAAEVMVDAAGGRPLIEMGSRRTDPAAAVAAARAAYVAGFASTSNLEAGRLYGVPTAGTTGHAFILAQASEEAAFAAQVAAQGPGTTLLVDTYDLDVGVRAAVAVAGVGLGAIRIDSGDLGQGARRARALLDGLGAVGTRIIVTGDLDEAAITALAGAPVDGFGVGTSVVTGLGAPTSGFIYKMVAASGSPDPTRPQRPVAKRSPGKATVGGRKWAWRLLADDGRAVGEEVALDDRPPVGPGRRLQQRVVVDGVVVAPTDLEAVRRTHRRAVDELAGRRQLPVSFRGLADR